MKRLIRFVLICLLAVPSMNYAAQAAGNGVETLAKQAIIVDFDTGEVLYEKNADERMPTSSMSKVITMYVIFDALKKGNLSLDDTFLVSEKAWRKGGSKMFVKVGDQVKIEDLIRGVIIQSGNDATIVLAEGLAGSEDAFAVALNRTAKELGMSNSHFMNASGWPDPDHYSTARDLSKLALAIVREFPEYYGYYSELEFEYAGISQGNRNPLLYRKIGADGIKTGHTEDGGYGLIGSGEKDGRRVIVVLNGMSSMQERADESARLLQWGLNGFKKVKLFSQARHLDTVPVYLGTRGDVAVRAEHEITMLVPKLMQDKIKVDVVYQSPVKAPIKQGDKLGTVKVTAPSGEVKDIPLVAVHDVDELGFFAKLIAKSRLLTTGQGVF